MRDARRMSLFRFLGLGARESSDDRDASEPRTVRRIAAQLEALDPETARFLAAFAYVLARVANADLEIDADETQEMQRIVEEVGDLRPQEAALAVEIAKSQTRLMGGTENYLVTREFARVASREQRARLIHRERRDHLDRPGTGLCARRSELPARPVPRQAGRTSERRRALAAGPGGFGASDVSGFAAGLDPEERHVGPLVGLGKLELVLLQQRGDDRFDLRRIRHVHRGALVELAFDAEPDARVREHVVDPRLAPRVARRDVERRSALETPDRDGVRGLGAGFELDRGDRVGEGPIEDRRGHELPRQLAAGNRAERAASGEREDRQQ
jgi:hypothetical protein